MSDEALDFSTVFFAKTPLGMEEIRTRGLNLSPLLRRTLILVDGKRSGAELAPLISGPSIELVLKDLLAAGCVEIVTVAAPPPEVKVDNRPQTLTLDSLPPAETRSPKDLEMARNFMTNTVNTMFGRNMRLTLIQAIFDCKSSAELRKVYPAWEEAMGSLNSAAKRLDEFRKSLFQFL